ncbi:MAG TPA: TMEM175 family protein, partial [Vitreoscilla sp.]|nr:TMEM175 family protein [Vitreoscilla sp.]
PEGMGWSALRPILPVALSYVLSFVYVGIYWNNHHHLFQLAQKTSGSVLWANLFLLFWLSLFPITTAWLGDHPHASAPSMLYGMVLLMGAISFYVLEQRIIAVDPNNQALKIALGRNFKGKLSPLCYVLGIVLAYFSPLLGQLIYALMAALWLIPDRGMEQAAQSHPE